MATVVAVGDIHTLVVRREDALRLMAATQARVRETPGCLSYAFAEVVDDPGHFTVVQEWRDEAALDDHYRSPAFAAYQEAIGELLARPSELRVYRGASGVSPQDSAPMDPRRAD